MSLTIGIGQTTGDELHGWWI